MLEQAYLNQMKEQLDEYISALSPVKWECTRDKELGYRGSKIKKLAACACSPKEKEKIQAAEREKLRKDMLRLRAQMEKERKEKIAALPSLLGKCECTLRSILEHYTCPIQVLSRQGLGTQERTHYMMQLDGAGPAELVSTAKWALDTKDRTLAATILVIADRGYKKYSNFDRSQFAETVVGEEFHAIHKGISDVRKKIARLHALAGKA